LSKIFDVLTDECEISAKAFRKNMGWEIIFISWHFVCQYG